MLCYKELKAGTRFPKLRKESHITESISFRYHSIHLLQSICYQRLLTLDTALLLGASPEKY
jgi:hypothetical protein